MSGRYSGFRRGSGARYGRSRRDKEQSDSIVVALTAQILLCVVVILAAGIAKKVDPPDYSILKGQYQSMVSDPGHNRELAQWVSERTSGQDGIGGVVNRAAQSLLERFADSGATEEPAQPQPSWEPAEELGETGESAFHYQYLRAGDPGGMGGMMPVDGDIKDLLRAPEGASLAPVTLAGRMITPVEGMVTSPYAYRLHPITDKTDFHNGVDIAAEEGRGILSALPGEVVEIVYDDEIYGNYIILQHASNLKTFYAHCSEIIAKEGMALRQGERIAKVGQTGTATGPHLHFSVIVDETYTDPLYILGDSIQLVED